MCSEDQAIECVEDRKHLLCNDRLERFSVIAIESICFTMTVWNLLTLTTRKVVRWSHALHGTDLLCGLIRSIRSEVAVIAAPSLPAKFSRFT